MTEEMKQQMFLHQRHLSKIKVTDRALFVCFLDNTVVYQTARK